MSIAFHTRRCSSRRIARVASRSAAAAFSITETVIATILLASVLSLIAQTAFSIKALERGDEERAVALQHVDNFLESIPALDDAEWTDARLTALAREQPRPGPLRAATWNVEVTPTEDPVAARRITVTLSWETPRGVRGGSWSLSTWVHAQPPTPDSNENNDSDE